MRKILVIGCMLLFGATLQAQEGLNVGINLGLPVGDASDFSSFSLGLDANYLWNVAESVDVGVATGFTNAFGKTFEILGEEFDAEDVQFIPIAAAGRYHVTDKFRAGADIGYAIGINDGNDGGFYYRPIVAYSLSDITELNFSYTGISLDGFTWSTISLGVMFSLL
jgi:hypothetical protein